MVKCKVCGSEMTVDTSVVLLSLPPKYNAFCENCGNVQSITCEEYSVSKGSESIPIEWIKKWKKKAADGSLCRGPLDLFDNYEYEEAIDRLLSDWEEEND